MERNIFNIFWFFIIVVVTLTSNDLVVLCYKEWSIGSKEYNCLVKRNITLYSTEIQFQLFHRIENELGPCIDMNVFDTDIGKPVTFRTKGMYGYLYGRYEQYEKLTLSDLQIITARSTTAYNKNTKQTLVIHLYYDSYHICKKLKSMKENGWYIIVLCNIFVDQIWSCVDEDGWLLRNWVFPYNILGKLLENKNTITSFIEVLKNPSFDRLHWLMNIRSDNLHHSCFSGQDIVVHIFVSDDTELFPLIQNAMIVTGQLSQQYKIHFNFHVEDFAMHFFWERNTEFINSILQAYGVKNEDILIEFEHEFQRPRFLQSLIMKMYTIKKQQNQRKHIFLDVMNKHKTNNCFACPNKIFKKSELENIHFYSESIYLCPLSKHCDNKFANIHPDVDIYNEDHFMSEINRLICNLK